MQTADLESLKHLSDCLKTAKNGAILSILLDCLLKFQLSNNSSTVVFADCMLHLFIVFEYVFFQSLLVYRFP